MKTLVRAALSLVLASAPALAQEPVNVAGASRIAVNGYDPVAFFTDQKPVSGSPSITAPYQGAIYLFANEEHKTLFTKDPAKFAPQFGGFCAFGAGEGALFPVDVSTWQVRGGKLYLNFNPEVSKKFNADFEANLAKAEKNWPQLVQKGGAAPSPTDLVNISGASGIAINGFDPVAFFTDQKPVSGSPSIRAPYQGATYLFANEQHRELFARDPAKYAPQYGGFCAFGVGLGALFPIDVNTWQIRDGKLYLNLNPDILKMFNANFEGNLAKAEKNWPQLALKNGR